MKNQLIVCALLILAAIPASAKENDAADILMNRIINALLAPIDKEGKATPANWKAIDNIPGIKWGKNTVSAKDQSVTREGVAVFSRSLNSTHSSNSISVRGDSESISAVVINSEVSIFDADAILIVPEDSIGGILLSGVPLDCSDAFSSESESWLAIYKRPGYLPLYLFHTRDGGTKLELTTTIITYKQKLALHLGSAQSGCTLK